MVRSHHRGDEEPPVRVAMFVSVVGAQQRKKFRIRCPICMIKVATTSFTDKATNKEQLRFGREMSSMRGVCGVIVGSQTAC